MVRHTPVTQKGKITVAEAATRKGVSAKSIRKWIAEGRLPAERLGDKIIRIDPDDLEQLGRRLGPAYAPDPVERIAAVLAGHPLTDEEIDRLTTCLRSGRSA